MTTIETDAADQALKAKHRAMWASGDYPAVASEIVAPLGPVLVEAAGVRRGDRVLDVGAGSGNAAIPAARTGASVVASDLTPELLDVGRALAADAEVSLEWQVADAEDLPFGDGEFDIVMSAIGVMFAPHHQAAADELIRVCRPGGTLSVLSWTPTGFVGQLFATMKPYAPPPPPGAQPAPLWGTEEHVRGLYGDRVVDVEARTGLLPVESFGDGAAFRDYFKRTYGPTIAVYRFLADDVERVDTLDRDLAALGDRHLDGGTAMEWEYLVVTGHRAR